MPLSWMMYIPKIWDVLRSDHNDNVSGIAGQRITIASVDLHIDTTYTIRSRKYGNCIFLAFTNDLLRQLHFLRIAKLVDPYSSSLHQ